MPGPVSQSSEGPGPPEPLPISIATDAAESAGAYAAVVVALDPDGTVHVITWGDMNREKLWAADVGNKIKKAVLKWPAKLCKAKPKLNKVKNGVEIDPEAIPL